MIDRPAGTTPEHYYRFCPRCGASLELVQVEEQLRLRCTNGDYVFYQNPHAAAGALIINGRDEILLVERKDPPMQGDWDLPGGFLDWGEQPLEAIIREIGEELNAAFTPQRLVGAYHSWYDTRGLAVSCCVLLYTGNIAGEPQPGSDAATLRWFPLDALPNNLAWEHIEKGIADFKQQRVAH